MPSLDLGHTRLIIEQAREMHLLRNELAYALATAFHETGATMNPVREAFGQTDAQSIARLESAWKAGQLKWVKTPYWRDGWFGRGFVQLTHKANYEVMGNRLGVDLVGNPDLAMDPQISAQIMLVGMREGRFTGKKLSQYITLHRSDFYSARRIINGMDRASLIAGYARQYDADLKAEGYGDTYPDKPDEVRRQPLHKPNWLMLIFEAIMRIFGR